MLISCEPIAGNHSWWLWLLLWQATRAKEVFAKHVESVLSKSAKIRSLIADLQRNYPDDNTAKRWLVYMLNIWLGEHWPVRKNIWKQLVYQLQPPPQSPRAIQQLNIDLNTLDGEYNKLSHHVAQGERDEHGET